MQTQRLFYHLRVPFPHGDTIVPLVVLLFHEDVSRLLNAEPIGNHLGDINFEGSAVIIDILGILRLHGASIIPMLGPDGNVVISSTSGALSDAGLGRSGGSALQPTYHGELVSVRFTLRPGDDEGRYTVLSHQGSAADGVKLRYTPVAGFTLYAHARHKQAEVERRRAALAGDAGKLVRYATNAAPSAAMATGKTSAAAAGSES